LKDLKFGNFNEEGIVKVVPQFDGMLHNSKQWMVMPQGMSLRPHNISWKGN
jgi:hypothetical protein